MLDYKNKLLSWHTLLLFAATLVMTLVSESSGDIPPPRQIKLLRPPPIGYPFYQRYKLQGKRQPLPLRVQHLHLNYPSPHLSSRPIKFNPPGPPRKYKPNIPPSKAHFNPSPPAHFLTPIIDNNEGAIHTIPAPNLGPNADRPIPPPAIVSSIAGAITPLDKQVRVQQHQPSYEVHEVGTIGLPYYAPDPDPSVPAPQVPVTRDPHSHPSNGKAPLDLLLAHHSTPKVSLAHLLSFPNDPNTEFLQAFQDQYKYQGSIDYDQQHAGSQTGEDDDVVADELDDESGAVFGQRIKTNKKRN